MELREINLDDIAEVERMIALRNSIFTPVSVETWLRDVEVTASVALESGEVIGAIPFVIREVRVSPQSTIRVAYANAVGVSTSRRGEGIGSELIDCAKEFLSERCEALFVLAHRFEASGRFYHKNGFVDMHMPDRLWWSGDTGIKNLAGVELLAGQEVQVYGLDTVSGYEHDMLNLFERAYGQFAGYPVRRPGFWGQVFSSAEMVMWRMEPFFLLARDRGKLLAYLILGKSGLSDQWVILEYANPKRDWRLGTGLIHRAMELAAGHRLKAAAPPMGDQIQIYHQLGFTLERELHRAVMALPLQPGAIAAKVWQHAPPFPCIDLWTPRAQWTLFEGADEKMDAVVEGEYDEIVRLLFGRCCVPEAVESERILVRGKDREELFDRMRCGIPFVRWIYFEMDHA